MSAGLLIVKISSLSSIGALNFIDQMYKSRLENKSSMQHVLQELIIDATCPIGIYIVNGNESYAKVQCKYILRRNMDS